MTEDLKNKFKSILFDTFEDDEEDEKEIKELNKLKKSAEETKITTQSPIKAQDILYRKGKSDTFIDLNETIRQSNEAKKAEEEYEFSAQISPMFGIIKEGDKKTRTIEPEIIDKSTKKPADDHLDIVLSPIYGYGDKNESSNFDYTGERKVLTDTQELSRLFMLEEEQNTETQEDNDPFIEKEINLFDDFGDR